MDRIIPHNFTASIEVNGHATEFEFTAMNIKILQLFQVHVKLPEQKRIRFHMQRNADGQFKITDRHRLPQEINMPEEQLANAIQAEHPGL
ncbi:hypothetical protein [Chitinophaga pinensis]|nr:hypothetical protein [Chitinophaga pinensis]